MTISYQQTRLILTKRETTKPSPTAPAFHSLSGVGYSYDANVYSTPRLALTLEGAITEFVDLALGSGTWNSGDAYGLIIEDAGDTTPGVVAVEDLTPILVATKTGVPLGNYPCIPAGVLLTASNPGGSYAALTITPPSGPPPGLFVPGGSYRAVITE
jgi:hypothetical protein